MFYSGETFVFNGGIQTAVPPVAAATIAVGASASTGIPLTFAVNVSQFERTSPLGNQAGSLYQAVDASACTGGSWVPPNPLASGLYFVPCDVALQNPSLTNVTIVSTGSVAIAGANVAIRALDELPAIVAAKGVSIEANTVTVKGDIWSGGAVKLTLTDGVVSCIAADSVVVDGKNAVFGPACSGPSS